MLRISHFSVQLICTLLFAALFCVFLAPVLVAHITNIGNLFGMAVSGLLTLFFLFNQHIANGLDSVIVAHPFCRRLVIVCLLIAVIAFAWFAGITGCILYAANKVPTEVPDAMIVLGCKVRSDNKPTQMLRRRLDVAYAYLTAHPDVVVVVSGGQGEDEQMTEAVCMYQYLVEKGIAPARILQEGMSSSTAENLQFSKELLLEQGYAAENITIVSDGYHQLRASMIAGEVGFSTEAVTAISAETALWLLPTYCVREWFGVTYQLLLA